VTNLLIVCLRDIAPGHYDNIDARQIVGGQAERFANLSLDAVSPYGAR
jgi:hypothetical protein